ncbi:MAG: DUF1329 domain-containing protein [Deltaproteobacteria bacterium]|nr:DUF1329 domain-containing protein [Deltaproteobacteria bacterium]MBW2665956.1 DUF1329 domain-containing protein [Deltaproteobacteria bacterium]
MRARIRIVVLAATLLALVAPARTEVSEEEAAKLGTTLTPIGAERAGNAAGTIPPWTGGITRPPAGFLPGQRHPDPFPEDRPLFTITAENAHEYEAHLSAGQLSMLGAYPDTWKLHVYPTRRSASYPEWVYDAVIANAARAKAVLEGKGGVENALISSPFPIPTSGVEVIWNHNLRWRGVRVSRAEGETAVTRSGRYTLIQSIQELGFPYASKEETSFTRRYPNVLIAIKEKIFAPALLSGNGAMVIETIDQTSDPRKAWSYSQSLRRVLRNPYVAYDFPADGSDSLRTVDDGEMFVGPPDRFEWKLHGKQEIYIAYNAYRLHDGGVGPKDILQRRHINPDLARYELHRVWKLEATLKDGADHIYSRRIFYLDEDSWQIALAESYDRDGRLWRINEAHALNHYEVPVHWSTLLVYHDLIARRYAITGLDNARKPPQFKEGGDPREFNPNALQYYVR